RPAAGGANDAQGFPAPPYALGTEVQVSGVVTAPTGTFSAIRTEIYVQDETGGILVYRSDYTHQVALGDSVTVVGVVGQYRGTTQIVPSSVQVAGQAQAEEPRPALCADVANAFLPDFTEPDESRLVRVEFAAYDATAGIITDGSGSCVLYIDSDTGISLTSGTYHITGIVKQWDPDAPYIDSYQLLPRFPSDVQDVGGPQFIAGPVEDDFNPNGFTVRWTTDAPAGARLLWGLENPGDLGSTSDSTQSSAHAITIDGLEPATIYRVQAICWNSTGENRSAVWAASTASATGCSGAINAYFTQSVAAEYATGEVANGNAVLQRRLLDRINGAASSIDACLYNLTVPEITSALIVARNRGVQVRVIAESENVGVEVNRLVAAGIPVLTDTAGPNDGAGYMHNKFLVFDFGDRTSAADDYVWTGSANITYNGFYENAENVILFQDQALAGAYTAEFEEMWGSSGSLPVPAMARFGSRKINNTPHRFLVGSSPVELYMSPSDGCTAQLDQVIAGAARGLYFSIFGFTSSDIEAALRMARDEQGVAVAGVFDAGQASSTSQYWPMSGQGSGAWAPPADVHLLASYPSMHHKYLLLDADNLADDAALVTGSFNWSWSAEHSNDENLLLVRDSRVANLYLQEFMARYHEAGGTDSLALDAASPAAGVAPYRLTVAPCPWRGASVLVVYAAGVTSATLHDLGGRLVGEAVNPSAVDHMRITAPGLRAGTYVISVVGRAGRASERAVYLGR
ncbi:MAG: phospholipase D-like domain-containing protein, partial [Candidatus Eisenbacteria bacterium]|nr:phospholipase D-like domain-containing protein [Candidatus Eisenbacteria bacterium]